MGRGGKARRGEERNNILSGLASLRMEHWHWEAAQEKKKEKKPQGCLCKVMISKRVQMSVSVITEEQQSPGWETSKQ